MDELVAFGDVPHEIAAALGQWAGASGIAELVPGTYYGSDAVVVFHDDDHDGIVDRIAAFANDGQWSEHIFTTSELARWAGENPSAGASDATPSPQEQTIAGNGGARGMESPAQRLGEWG